MGGIDKGLLPFHGKPLVDIAIAKLKPYVADIMISANRNLGDYESRGYRVLKDESLRDDGSPGYEGPLAGILSGLKASTTPWLMVLPCDAPMFPADIVTELWQRIEVNTKAAHIDGHPTFALIHVSSLPRLEHFLQRGERKLGAWLESIGSVAHSCRVDADFRNLNTPQDLS